MASTAGLKVEIIGSGTAREQAPAPGTQGSHRHKNRRPLQSLVASLFLFVSAVSIRTKMGAPSKPRLSGKATNPTQPPVSHYNQPSDMIWKDLIAEITAVGVLRRLRRARHRHRVRLPPRAARLRLCCHEGRHHRRQSLHRQGHRRRRARHHHRLRRRPSIISSSTTPRFPSSKSSTAAARSPKPPPHSSAIPSKDARSHRHHRHQRQNHHGLSRRSAPQRRRPQNRPHRHHRIPCRRRSPPLASHHARVARSL